MPKIMVNEDSKRSIIKIIDSWKGKLTWEKLCQKVSSELEFDQIISRHTLLAYDDIKHAFSTKKSNFKNAPEKKFGFGDLALEKAYERISTLESTNDRLEKEITATREQFVRWQYNMHRLNLDMEKINKQIDEPLVDFSRANRK